MGEVYIALEECNFDWAEKEVEMVTRMAYFYWPKLLLKSEALNRMVEEINKHRITHEKISQLDVFLLVLDLAQKGRFDRLARESETREGLCDDSTT